LTPESFEQILARAVELLTEAARQSTSLYLDPRQFQEQVRAMLSVAAKDSGFEVHPTFHPHAFPDVRVNGYGVEVKHTTKDTWLAVANSIFEGMRDPEVHSIYVVYGKLGGAPEVRWRRYEDCVTHVRVSHSPRFVVEMEGTRAPLFAHMGISYDRFAQLTDEEKMQHVREYSRQRPKKSGERLWWLEPSHSVPLNVRIYMHLLQHEKRALRAEGALLCPQICKPSRARAKYEDVTTYLLTYHGVLAPQARDLFSAGSVSDRVAPIYEGEPRISRGLRGIEPEMRLAALHLDDALLMEYWGEACPADERIREWLRRADEFATDWTPSDNLFRSLG